MGGMQSLVTAWLKPQRSQRMVSISGCGRAGPSSIALQYGQRSALLLIITIDPVVISSERASQPLPSPTFNILKRDFQACRASLKPINDSNNVQNQSIRVNARGPLKDNRRSGKWLMEETLEEPLAQGLSTGGTSEDPSQTVGLDNGCKQSPETDRYGCDSIQQTLLSQEDQKGEDLVK
ncbi:hypothetical protein BY996DRAFT_6411457 [Phakopsora pachyrhizi]|nr:hypothetical protein BY996DRAFT_6411457 [Phakopsora pachyrhizi]